MFNRLREFLFVNSTTRQTIAKNATWLVAGQFGARVSRAAIVIFAARVLGAAHWGAFSYAIGITTLLTVFSDLGINGTLTRAGSAAPGLRTRYLASALAAKGGLLAIAVAGVLLAMPWISTIAEARALMPILLAVFVFDTLRDLGSAFARALERMELEAMFTVFTNFAIAALGFVFLSLSPNTASLAAAYALGSGAGLLAFAYALRRHLAGLLASVDRRLIREIFSTAWPFGLFGLMGIAMLSTDTIILGWLKSPEEVGYYSAAQKIIQLFYVIPSLLAASAFPALTRLIAAGNRSAARALLTRLSFLLFAVAVPVALAGALFAQPLVTLLFGAAYAAAAAPFAILITTVLIVFPSAIAGNAVFAYHKERSFLPAVAVSFFGNIILDLVLIPRFGISGAAVATLLTQLATNAFIWARLANILKKSPA